jgi:hypothetical protein
MPRLPLLAVLCLAAAPLAAQFFIRPPDEPPAWVIDGVDVRDDAPVFERPPTFPGGREELYRFLMNRARPLWGGEAGFGGHVAAFSVDAAGRVRDVRLLQGQPASMDAEWLRVLGDMPDWEPAVIDGVETATLVYLPLVYVAQGGRVVLDEGFNKAVMGRRKKSGWLKGLLLGGALALLAALLLLS